MNLTRFPLFFPEKRTFFLEGADIFDFGLGLEEDVIPFFSRRIGLFSGTEVPLDAGLKVNGRAAGASYGALVARTGEADTLTTEGGYGRRSNEAERPRRIVGRLHRDRGRSDRTIGCVARRTRPHVSNVALSWR